MKTSKLEELMAFQLFAVGLKGFQREYKFCDTRRWRSDFAFPDRKLLVECEGAIYSNGRHTRGSGYEADLEKYNTATLLGFKVLRFSLSHIQSGEAIRMIQEILK